MLEKVANFQKSTQQAENVGWWVWGGFGNENVPKFKEANKGILVGKYGRTDEPILIVSFDMYTPGDNDTSVLDNIRSKEI